MSGEPQVYVDAFDGKLRVRMPGEPFLDGGTVQVPAHLVAEALAEHEASA